jgi:hypothetical protein
MGERTVSQPSTLAPHNLIMHLERDTHEQSPVKSLLVLWRPGAQAGGAIHGVLHVYSCASVSVIATTLQPAEFCLFTQTSIARTLRDSSIGQRSSSI